MKIMKFGGTSVGRPERMQQVADLITRDNEQKIVVLSALSGTTNALVSIGESLANGDKEAARQQISKLEAHYEHFIRELLKKEDTFAKAKGIAGEHFEFLYLIGNSAFNETLNKNILAQGELLSTKIFSLYLQEIGQDHVLLP